MVLHGVRAPHLPQVLVAAARVAVVCVTLGVLEIVVLMIILRRPEVGHLRREPVCGSNGSRTEPRDSPNEPQALPTGGFPSAFKKALPLSSPLSKRLSRVHTRPVRGFQRASLTDRRDLCHQWQFAPQRPRAKHAQLVVLHLGRQRRLPLRIAVKEDGRPVLSAAVAELLVRLRQRRTRGGYRATQRRCSLALSSAMCAAGRARARAISRCAQRPFRHQKRVRDR